MTIRFKTFLDQLHLSPSEFADRIGVQRSSMSHILSGRNKPSIEFLEKILIEFPETDINWLITGRTSSKVMPAGSGITLNEETTSRNNRISEEDTIKKPALQNEEPVEKIIIVYKNNSFRILYPSDI